MPTPQTQWRSPRVRLDDAAPAILRASDGRQQRGMLEVLSLNGGLLAMSSTLAQGSRVKVLFVTQTGPVLGAAEMLPPVSPDHQPFRFVSIDKADQVRLRATLHSLAEPAPDAWIEKYRAALPKRPPAKHRFLHFLRSLI